MYKIISEVPHEDLFLSALESCAGDVFFHIKDGIGQPTVSVASAAFLCPISEVVSIPN